MPDSDRINLDRAGTSPDVADLDVDLAGLAAATGQAFKPHFDDVLARAGRRRRVRIVVAVLVAAGVAAGGSTAFAVTAGHRAAPVSTTPTPSIAPWHTAAPGSARAPAPQPVYTQIAPGAYDITEPDKPLTGIFTELHAGDLNHLYLEYEDCAGGTCRRMLATSADRGRTWRKLPMPAGLVREKGYSSIVMVRRSLVVAVDSILPRINDSHGALPAAMYWTSTDGGATWRRPTVRTADVLPAGWPVRTEAMTRSIAAVDPATGDVVRMPMPGEMRVPADTPATAGIWLLGDASETIPSPLPKGYQPQSRSVAMVSRDGGRTWDTRPLPDTPTTKGDQSGSVLPRLTTLDGKTVYTAQERDGTVRIQVSTDGARTWHARALIDLDGPLLSLLPTGDGTVLVEGPTGAYRSTDQARTFTRVGPSLGSHAYPLPGGGYAIPTNNNETSVWLSPDGAAWTYVPRPDVP